MPQLSSKSLTLLVQLVDDKIAELEGAIQSTAIDPSELADIEEELMWVSSVESELESLYKAAHEADPINLCPYAELTPYRAAQVK